MRRYRLAARVFFGVVFVVGAVVHFVMGRSHPEGYRVYGDTALLPALARLWSGFVMPNIGWLTLCCGALELLVGVALLWGGRAARVAAVAILGFFAFLLVLGYGWPTGSWGEDLLKNRLGTVVMAALIAPLVNSAERSRGRGSCRPRRAEHSEDQGHQNSGADEEAADESHRTEAPE